MVRQLAWRWLQRYLLSPHFQLGVQLAVCTLLASLPTVVRSLHFPHACFAPVLSTIGLISMSPDGHLGTKARAAASLAGETWLGAALAGATVSVAKPLQGPHPSAYPAVLCVTSSLGVAALAAPRAGPQPLNLWPDITVSSLVYCTVVLYGQHTQGLAAFWATNVLGILLAGCTASVAVLLAGALVLPSAASEEAVQLVSAAVRGAGHSMTRYLSLLLDTTPAKPVATEGRGGGPTSAAAAADGADGAAPAGPAAAAAAAAAPEGDAQELASSGVGQDSMLQQRHPKAQPFHRAANTATAVAAAVIMSSPGSPCFLDTCGGNTPASAHNAAADDSNNSASSSMESSSSSWHSSSSSNDEVNSSSNSCSSNDTTNSNNVVSSDGESHAGVELEANADEATANIGSSSGSNDIQRQQQQRSVSNRHSISLQDGAGTLAGRLHPTRKGSTINSGASQDSFVSQQQQQQQQEQQQQQQHLPSSQSRMDPELSHSSSTWQASNVSTPIQQQQQWPLSNRSSLASSGGVSRSSLQQCSSASLVFEDDLYRQSILPMALQKQLEQYNMQQQQHFWHHHNHHAAGAQQQQQQQQQQQSDQGTLPSTAGGGMGEVPAGCLHDLHQQHHRTLHKRHVSFLAKLKQQQQQEQEGKEVHQSHQHQHHILRHYHHRRRHSSSSSSLQPPAHEGGSAAAAAAPAKGPQVLGSIQRHNRKPGEVHSHAVLLQTAAGPVTLLGPSVDELRPMLLRAQSCLRSALCEPPWLNPWQSAAQLDLGGWRDVATAAQQLVSMMSALQDVLVHGPSPSPHLIDPALAIHGSARSFSETAGTVIFRAITSCADVSRALLLLLQHHPTHYSCSTAGSNAHAAQSSTNTIHANAVHSSTDTVAAAAAAAAALADASSSWADARAQLLHARTHALHQYWYRVVHNTRVRVARQSQTLAVMFVWVIVGGLLDAVQQLETAGLELLQAQAAASNTSRHSGTDNISSSSSNSFWSKENPATAAAVRHSAAALREMAKAAAMLPVLSNLAAIVGACFTKPWLTATASIRRTWLGVSVSRNVKQASSTKQQAVAAGAITAAATAPPRADQQGLFQLQQLGIRVLHSLPATVLDPSSSSRQVQQKHRGSRAASGAVYSAMLQTLARHRSTVAAFKLWLALSLLMALMIVLSDNPGGAVWPAVVTVVLEVPTHGVIAFVLAWHERVESTSIRVLLRILGTCAGASLGVAAIAITPSSAPGLIATLCGLALLLAPMASASFHLRLATALTYISACVVVLCQYDMQEGRALGGTTFYVGRLVEVSLACLWAALFNSLLLPWSSADWCRERLAHSYTAAAQLLLASCELQFAAYRHLTLPPAAQQCNKTVLPGSAVLHDNAPGGDVVLTVQEPSSEQWVVGGSSQSQQAELQQQHQQQQQQQQQQQTGSTGLVAQQQQTCNTGLRQQQQQELSELRSSLQSQLVAPLVAVQQAVHLEVSLWHHHAPRGMAARSVKKLLKAMLDLADHMTALQAAVAALPSMAVQETLNRAMQDSILEGKMQGQVQTAAASLAAPTADGDDTKQSNIDQQQQQTEGAAAAAALQYLTSALMQPLHAAAAAELVLLQQAGEALRDVLLLPTSRQKDTLVSRSATEVADSAISIGATATTGVTAAAAGSEPLKRLRGVVLELQQQRHDSRACLLQLRRTLHYDIRQQQKSLRRSSAGLAATGTATSQEGSSSTTRVQKGVDQNVQRGMNQQQQQQQDGEEADGVLNMWWLHGGAHYMQQLAFQYAFDKVVDQMLVVAELAMTGRSSRHRNPVFHRHHHPSPLKTATAATTTAAAPVS